LGLNRFAKRKDSTQEAIVKALRKAGVKVWILDTPCDLLTKWAGLWLPLEVKGPKTKVTPNQDKFCKENAVPVVRDELEALRAVGVI
jgi:hypothetical protein